MTISAGIGSKPFLIFETPKPKSLSARFIYNYYERDEFVSYPSFVEGEVGPRRIELTFGAAQDLIDGNALGNQVNDYIPTFIEQLETKLTSETLLQSSGFLKYISDTRREFSYVYTSQLNAGEAVNTADAYFENASTVQGQDFASVPHSTTTYLNPSTNRPTSEAADATSERANESFIASDVVFDLMEASAANPFSIHSRSNSVGLRDLKSLQQTTRRNTNPLVYAESQYSVFVDYIDLEPEIESALGSTYGLGLIGYVLFKNEVDREGNIVNTFASQLLLNLEQTTFDDHAVKYGKLYQYSLHPLIVVRRPSASASTSDMFIMVGAKAKVCRILAVENVPPPPVEAIEFVYLGNGNVNLRWSPPAQYGELSERIIGDIKGYQVFSRTDLNEGFELRKYITFNDMIGSSNFPLQEFVPEQRIRRANYHVTEHTLYFERDKTYIISLCTIDAHGNSSNLSPQYYVKLDSYSNSLIIDFASFKGAPKQYPNLLMSKKVFLDSMKTSNKGKMTVYFCPKYTHVLNGNSTALSEATPVIANSSEDVPSYRIQFINTDKQEDKILDISLLE